MKINYGFLKAKIQEKCGNQVVFAKELGISPQSLSAKLNNKSSFSHEQITKSKEILKLNTEDLERCFFIRL